MFLVKLLCPAPSVEKAIKKVVWMSFSTRVGFRTFIVLWAHWALALHDWFLMHSSRPTIRRGLLNEDMLMKSKWNAEICELSKQDQMMGQLRKSASRQTRSIWSLFLATTTTPVWCLNLFLKNSSLWPPYMSHIGFKNSSKITSTLSSIVCHQSNNLPSGPSSPMRAINTRALVLLDMKWDQSPLKRDWKIWWNMSNRTGRMAMMSKHVYLRTLSQASADILLARRRWW